VNIGSGAPSRAVDRVDVARTQDNEEYSQPGAKPELQLSHAAVREQPECAKDVAEAITPTQGIRGYST